MYRIAVIQNEIEMQHSGYVDSIPKFKKQNFDLFEHVFNRFSSVNVRELFIEGENFLLDYDCLIIGTNATSDGDLYNVLCEANSKEIIKDFIHLGKGLLICSQKKFKPIESMEELLKPRETFFLPDEYDYIVASRPKEESSADGSIKIISKEPNEIQKFMLSYPQKITDSLIEEHCINNDFQKHYYRDYIIPIYHSSYFPILIGSGSHEKNTLMVACPQRNEKIVISTMALDWAGHYELLENILYYLVVGIPTVAFINKKDSVSKEFEFIISEAKLAKTPFISYKDIEEIDKDSYTLKQFHSLYVFSPEYQEAEVASFWDSIEKPRDRYIKLIYYKHVNQELVLVNFSYSSYIDAPKKEVEIWLRSQYLDGLWGGSFWKTFDAIFALKNMGGSIKGYLKSMFLQIYKHYQNGSYDGVLAPSCGLLELEAMVRESEEYSSEIDNIEILFCETKRWLLEKYNNTSKYNKKFIIRSFYNCGLINDLKSEINKFKESLLQIALDGTVQDKLEIDLCLDIDVCSIYLEAFGEKREVKNKIIECLSCILSKQLQNGRWDNNLGKTSRLLVFLLNHMEDSEFQRTSDKLQSAINLGLAALKNSYSHSNWEDNIVTTANAITALIVADKKAEYESKDFLNQVNHEAKLADSYNSILLALKTIDDLTLSHSNQKKELYELKQIQGKFKKSQARLRISSAIASVSVMLVLSYYVFLFLKDINLFKSMIFESFMWIPLAIGILITWIVEFLQKIITKIEKDK